MPELTMLRAEARFVVEDGPSGRRLDVVTLETRDEGGDPLSMRARALLVLRQELQALVDEGAREVDVALLPIDDPRARGALALAEGGDWPGSAGRYGARIEGEDFVGLAPRERAAWLFNAAQAGRVAACGAGADSAVLLQVAAERLRAAMALDPQPIFAEALEGLAAQRREFGQAAAQRDAAVHNFGLLERSAPPPVAPAIPEGYR